MRWFYLLSFWTVTVSLAAPSSVRAQKVNLSENHTVGDFYKITTQTTLTGTLKVIREGRSVSLDLQAKNEHKWIEKELDVQENLPRKVARYYESTRCSATVEKNSNERSLPTNKSFIVAQRFGETHLCYSPVAPLTKSELEVVSEHFDPMFLSGLLPEKEVAVGDTWKIPDRVMQALGLFEGLVSNEIVVKLSEITAEQAILTITGDSSGIEYGALNKITVTATARYDLKQKRITSVEWKQKDNRDQGPVSPAAEVESTTLVTREFLAAEPKNFPKTLLEKVPIKEDPPGNLKALLYEDVGSSITFLYPREWYFVARTEQSIIFRLLDRGDFIAQATLSPLPKVEAGKGLSNEEFEDLVKKSSNWEMTEVVEKGTIPTDRDRHIYRVVGKGNLDGIPVFQAFYRILTRQGEQAILTITAKPTQAPKIGTRDAAFANAIEWKK